MKADECHSLLNLASRGAVPQPAVRQWGRLIAIYTSSPSATRYLLLGTCCVNGLFTSGVVVGRRPPKRTPRRKTRWFSHWEQRPPGGCPMPLRGIQKIPLNGTSVTATTLMS